MTSHEIDRNLLLIEIRQKWGRLWMRLFAPGFFSPLPVPSWKMDTVSQHVGKRVKRRERTPTPEKGRLIPTAFGMQRDP